VGAVLRQVSGSKGTGLTFADVACAMGKGKASPNVHTSAQDAAQNKIAAAQRARWAKVKAQQRAEKKIA